MTPGLHNGLFQVCVEMKDDYREDLRKGFYVADAAKSEDMFSKMFKQDTKGMTTEQIDERLEGIRNEVIDMGYEVGPIETKTHREWAFEIWDCKESDLPEEVRDDIDVEDAVELGSDDDAYNPETDLQG